MLSVAKCGYDNAYGVKYRIDHDHSDLQVLKRLESYITVKGGEHCGELYGICVSIPASLDEDMLKAYYEALCHLFETGDLKANLIRYGAIYETAFSPVQINEDTQKEFYEANLPWRNEIVDISKVMMVNYDIYDEKVWLTAKKALSGAIDQLNDYLGKNDYMGQWERALGYPYRHDDFYAVLCNSIQDGPQAIDISDDRDVLYLHHNVTAMAAFISHEFGVYMLMGALEERQDAGYFAAYKIRESLAEYFNRPISGGCASFNEYEEYIQFFDNERHAHPLATVKEMYHSAMTPSLRAAENHGGDQWN
jgi:hypothetical protein